MIIIIQILHLYIEILIQPLHANLLWNKNSQWKKETQQGEPIAHPNKLFKQRNKTHETQCIKAKTNTSKNVNEIESKVETKKQTYM
jgi:hypothetical protein